MILQREKCTVGRLVCPKFCFSSEAEPGGKFRPCDPVVKLQNSQKFGNYGVALIQPSICGGICVVAIL